MVVKSFDINGVTYNACIMSAVQQDELLSLLTSTIMDRALQASIHNIEMGEDVLIPLFMSMPHDIKTRVASKLMHKVVINGTNTIVTVDNFGGNMVGYNKLLAQLLLWNLSDFFDWLRGVVKSGETQAQLNQM